MHCFLVLFFNKIFRFLNFQILGNLVNLNIDGHNFTTLSKNLFAEQEIAGRVEVVRLTNGPLNDVPIEVFQVAIIHKLTLTYFF